MERTYRRGGHPFVIKGGVRLTIPNPHRGDIDWSLMRRILKQGQISEKDWENA
jgi:hypothetical protein